MRTSKGQSRSVKHPQPREYLFIDTDGKYHIVEATDFIEAFNVMDEAVGNGGFVYYPKPIGAKHREEARVHTLQRSLFGDEQS